MFKRTFDVLAASLLLLLSLPMIGVAIIAIKLDSEGPAFFCQDRMGRRCRRFRVYKLRTMAVDTRGSSYTLGADKRITRAGRWLRRSKIDELPQLWNVLRGEMSMVGPRPVIPQIAMEFDWAYARLLSVRPGLTDPASLKYCNETDILEALTDADRHFKTVITPDKIRISIAYIRQATLWSDFLVVAKTGLALLSPAMRRRYCKAPGPLPVLVSRPTTAPARVKQNPVPHLVQRDVPRGTRRAGWRRKPFLVPVRAAQSVASVPSVSAHDSFSV